MEISENRLEYLKTNGWELTFDAETMKKFTKVCQWNIYYLYIHDFEGKLHCELYTDSDYREEIFSYRNMISELKKRAGE